MYKVMVSDLDGTLLNAEHRLGDDTRAVLDTLRRLGVGIMLASGRHFQDIHGLSRSLHDRDCLISSNGAAVHDSQSRLLQYSAIDPICLPFLLCAPEFNRVQTNVYRIDDWLVETPAPNLLRYHRESGFTYRVVDFARRDDAPVLKVFYYHDDTDHLRDLERLILERHGDRLTTTYSLPIVLEVMARGVSKGEAIAQTLKRHGILPADVIAFGDGRNDLEMLRDAGKGVLMGNAVPELKAALPDLEVIGSNAEESVAHYLEHVFRGGDVT